MALPANAVVRVTWDVTSSPTNTASLIPGGNVSVSGTDDAVCDAQIRTVLETRKNNFQGNVDTLNEVLGKLP